MPGIYYRAADIGGLKISYREAGQPDAPTLLLLHGFPTAGHMFRDLIPLLADRAHIVAPDLPGFGNSDMPDEGATSDRIPEPTAGSTGVIGLAAMPSTCSITARRPGSGSPSSIRT